MQMAYGGKLLRIFNQLLIEMLFRIGQYNINKNDNIVFDKEHYLLLMRLYMTHESDSITVKRFKD